MSGPVRVQLKQTKGWRMPPNTVRVDRSTRWGNPFRFNEEGFLLSPSNAVALFERQLFGKGHWQCAGWSTDLDDVIDELRGKNLACWCPLDKPCHADLLLRIANESQS